VKSDVKSDVKFEVKFDGAPILSGMRSRETTVGAVLPFGRNRISGVGPE
jgi:hypothetical protein